MAWYRKHAANTLRVYLLSELVSGPPPPLFFWSKLFLWECLRRWFLGSRAFGQSARALEVAVYLNIPSLDTQSFNFPPSPILSSSLFFFFFSQELVVEATKMHQAPTTTAQAENILFSLNLLLLFPSLTHSLTLTFLLPPQPLTITCFQQWVSMLGVTQFTAAPLS